MPGSRAVLVVDALIVITLLAAAGVAATVILTATQSIPTLTIGGAPVFILRREQAVPDWLGGAPRPDNTGDKV